MIVTLTYRIYIQGVLLLIAKNPGSDFFSHLSTKVYINKCPKVLSFRDTRFEQVDYEQLKYRKVLNGNKELKWATIEDQYCRKIRFSGGKGAIIQQ